MIEKTEADIKTRWSGRESPLVSVCCATFNHEHFIEEALDGFLMQETDFPFEIVVRDDCSTDRTAEIVRSYAKKFPNIVRPIYEPENKFSKGIRALPTLFRNSAGKYIAVCEGDDYWTDKLKLQKQINFLKENRDFVITYAAVEAFDENGIVHDYLGGATYDLNSGELKKWASINTPTACFRNVIPEFPPEFGVSKMGDVFLWSLLGHFGKGKFLGQITPVRYRIHNRGIWSRQSKKKRMEMAYMTAFALYSYYARVKEHELARFFLEKHVNLSMSLHGRGYFLLVLVKRYFRLIQNHCVKFVVK